MLSLTDQVFRISVDREMSSNGQGRDHGVEVVNGISNLSNYFYVYVRIQVNTILLKGVG